MMKRTMLIAALSLTTAMAQAEQFRGTVTDSMCGKEHMMKNVSAADCTRECVKAGSSFALVVGDKVYTLKGDKAQLDKFAGSPVVVNGDLNGSLITVTNITAAH